MYLGQLLKSVKPEHKKIFAQGISFDSRNIKKSDIFFAITGNKTSGIKFVQDAIFKGASAIISEKMGLIDMACVHRQEKLLETFGLPTFWRNINHEQIKLAMKVDKKTVGKSINWVLLENIGKAVIRSDVPEDIVESTMKEVL